MDYDKKASIAGTCQHFYVVKRGRYVRELQRNHVARTRREVIVPDFALFKAPDYDYLTKTSTFECKELYQLKENVVVLTEQFFGCTGTVE